MNLPQINITLENKNKYKAVSLYPLVQEIYQKYLFQVQTEDLITQLQNEINSAIDRYYPKIHIRNRISISVSGIDISLYFSAEFIKEMEYIYPEALI